jgi:hypothetical protein
MPMVSHTLRMLPEPIGILSETMRMVSYILRILPEPIGILSMTMPMVSHTLRILSETIAIPTAPDRNHFQTPGEYPRALRRLSRDHAPSRRTHPNRRYRP